MNFDLTPDQKLLETTVANFARKESPVTRFRKLREDPLGFSKTTWKQMGDLGWLGLYFPEDAGGYGGSFVDVALVLEQLGQTLVPEPIVPSVLLGGLAIARAGNAAQKERWLSPMIAGDTSLAFAYAEKRSRHTLALTAMQAHRSHGGYRLSGRKDFVLNGRAADQIVVLARTSGAVGDAAGLSLFVVDPGQKGLTSAPVDLLDGHKAAHLDFDAVEVGEEMRLGAEGEAHELAVDLLDHGAAAACAEGVGIMRAVLAMTTDYLRTREQFGVKIGTFQALQHRAVDMFIEAELAKSTSILAAIKIADADPTERRAAISAAKAQLTVSGRLVTQQAIQLHGGVGITEEHDVGLYFKRMHALMSLFGDEEHHLARYASLPSFTANVQLPLERSVTRTRHARGTARSRRSVTHA